jgi:hypothetical protein
VLVPALAQAQRTSVVRGHVTTADSARRPLTGVEVAIPALGRGTRVDQEGAFTIDALPAGTHEVIARRVGFEPVTRQVTVSGAGDTVTLVLALAPRVVELTQVDVRDKATESAGLRAYERERARSNGGAFIGDSLLARNEHSAMSNVLRRVPGAGIIRYQTSRQSYNVLGSRRGSASIRAADKNCYYQIYVDGQRRFVPTSSNVEPPPDVDDFKVADYEAIEIYRGPAQTPMQFTGTGATCGTIIFWTRTRR